VGVLTKAQPRTPWVGERVINDYQQGGAGVMAVTGVNTHFPETNVMTRIRSVPWIGTRGFAAPNDAAVQYLTRYPTGPR
jgi:hypothetical protein